MDTFPLYVPSQYSSVYETNLTTYEDSQSAFEKVSQKGFLNTVREVSETITFSLDPLQLPSCLAVLKKNSPFILRKSLTESITVRCSKYIYRKEPNLVVLEITIKQIFMP